MDRALAIVELLSRHAGGLPLMTVGDTLSIPRSATHRLLADLKEEGYVRQDFEGGPYRLTAKIVALGFSHLAAAGVSARIQPLVDRLAEDTGELVALAVIHDERLIRPREGAGRAAWPALQPGRGRRGLSRRNLKRTRLAVLS